MRDRVMHIPRRHIYVGDDAVLRVAGLVIQIAEGVRFPGAVQKTAFRIGNALRDLSGLLRVISDRFFDQSGFVCFLIELLHVLGRLVGDLDDLAQIVSGVGADVSGIRQQQFPGDEAFLHAPTDNLIEDILKQSGAVELPAAELGERGMIRNGIVQFKAEEPAVGDIDADLPFQLPLGADPVQVTDQQHFDDDDRIDGRSAGGGIEILHQIIDERKIHQPVEIAEEVILRHEIVDGSVIQLHLVAVGACQHGVILRCGDGYSIPQTCELVLNGRRDFVNRADTLGPRLMAEIGDPRRFHSAKALIAYAGIDAPPYQSGQFTGTNRHISKRGSKVLRKIGFELITAMNTNKRFYSDDPVCSYFMKKRDEGKHYRVAMFAAYNKFLRIYHARVSEVLNEVDSQKAS